MKLTIITEFDSDTPMHMIDPMNDSIFNVVCVIYNIKTTPPSTPGTALTAAQCQPRRFEICGEQNQNRQHRNRQAHSHRTEHFVHWRNLPTSFHPHPLGGLAGIRIAC